MECNRIIHPNVCNEIEENAKRSQYGDGHCQCICNLNSYREHEFEIGRCWGALVFLWLLWSRHIAIDSISCVWTCNQLILVFIVLRNKLIRIRKTCRKTCKSTPVKYSNSIKMQINPIVLCNLIKLKDRRKDAHCT